MKLVRRKMFAGFLRVSRVGERPGSSHPCPREAALLSRLCCWTARRGGIPEGCRKVGTFARTILYLGWISLSLKKEEEEEQRFVWIVFFNKR